ncbi:MAG TPA: C-terminal binding protein, partial [bacterium]|nr:C-terminal binding protein [bacterium]
MAKYSVFMTDSIFPDTAIERNELGRADAELTFSSAPDAETLIREGRDCDAMLVVYAQVDANVINSLTRCKVIVRVGIGFNNVDLDAASKAGIFVANVPDYCLDEVADHTMALVLSVVRRTCFLNSKVESGIWSIADAKPIPRLRGKVFGIFGCGAIGQQVGHRASAFGMEVVGYDPYASKDAFSDNGIRQI